jgi:hypothetical protein
MVGRNESCPCGSGKKYKKCCLDKDQQADIQKLIAYPKLNSPDPTEDGIMDSFWDLESPDNPYPEIGEEESLFIDQWWDKYESIKNFPEEVLTHIFDFFEKHPELAENLGLDEFVIFDLGYNLYSNGNVKAYIDFLLELRVKFPQVYERSSGFFDFDIIAWLIIEEREEEIENYFGFFAKSPSNHIDQLFEIINLLTAKDLKSQVEKLIKAVKEGIFESDEILQPEEILIPLIYIKAQDFLFPDSSEERIRKFVESYIEEYPSEPDADEEVFHWIKRMENIFREYRPWEINLKSGKNELVKTYFMISDHYMHFLHENYNLSWLAVKYHSDLIYEYGCSWMNHKHGKPKTLYDFKPITVNKLLPELTNIGFGFISPVALFSTINAIYYFAEYLSSCQMMAPEEVDIIKSDMVKLYEEQYPKVSFSYKEAKCFEKFPFWS